MPIGINWHQLIGTSAVSLADMLSLPAQDAGNVIWLGASTSNTGTICIGFNWNVTCGTNGARSATDGWPLGPGDTLPLLPGEGFNVGDKLFAIADIPAQDLLVIGYAPLQGAMPLMTNGSLLLQTSGQLLLQTGGRLLLEN